MGSSYGTIASADGQQLKLGSETLGVQPAEDISIDLFSTLGLFTAMSAVVRRW